MPSGAFPDNSPFYPPPVEPPAPLKTPPLDNVGQRQQTASIDQLSYRLDDAYYALQDANLRDATHAIEQARQIVQELTK